MDLALSSYAPDSDKVAIDSCDEVKRIFEDGRRLEMEKERKKQKRNKHSLQAAKTARLISEAALTVFRIRWLGL